jgi:16S rRNA (cytosine1402-N4)-methyltransferase
MYMTHETITERHIPVLLQEVIEHLAIQSDDIVVDGTLGAGGHAQSMLEQLSKAGTYIGIDQDSKQLAITRDVILANNFPATQHFVHNNFRNLDDLLAELGISEIDKALFDLGLSSMQLDTPEYGMSFMHDAPLSMTMNQVDAVITAFDVVNDWQEETLADIIYAFGDERYARRIARAIVESRATQPIRTTFELVDIIKQAVPAVYRNGKTHCATRTFQAIRIAVNDEYTAITDGLTAAIKHLAPKGRIAVITFHSGEDRIVKHLFKQQADEKIVTLVNKKPITPSDEELAQNPRARSAKLRISEKL